jgi:cell division protein FtsN
MLGDFRRRAERRSRHSARDWRWFAAGFLAGTICLGLAWLTFGTRECPEPATTTAPVAAPGPEEAAATTPGPAFTFPQVLEKQEVVVPDAAVAARTEPAPPAPPPAKDDSAASAAAPGGGSFVLQVAALRTAADAHALKARLAEQGLPAQVQAAMIGNDTFHRVRLGPYRDLGAAQDAQARLQRAGYAGLIVRLK